MRQELNLGIAKRTPCSKKHRVNLLRLNQAKLPLLTKMKKDGSQVSFENNYISYEHNKPTLYLRIITATIATLGWMVIVKVFSLLHEDKC